jgi:GNAT superfamily N-acetyltransferase
MTDGYSKQESEEKVFDPSKAQVGDNPKHKLMMAWGVDDELGDHRIDYYHGSMGGTTAHNYVMSTRDGVNVARLGLHGNGEIGYIETHPDLRRKGLATKLYNTATELHGEIDSLPAPLHSKLTTSSGKAWAKAVGGPIGGKGYSEQHVPDKDYKSYRWKPIPGMDHHKLTEHVNEFVAKAHSAGLDNYTTTLVNDYHQQVNGFIKKASEHEPGSQAHRWNMEQAHSGIDEMGERVNDITHGELDEDHEKLQEHIGSLY